MMQHVIQPVVEPRGYAAIRGDQMARGGLITTQVLDRIIKDDLVIADLTDQNPNVFYELAVRHAVRKPFVQLMVHDQTLPFDIQGMRTIWINLNDLDSVYEAKQQLGSAIDAMEQEAEIVTPISVALTLQDLRDSSRPEERSLSQIIEMLQSMMDAIQEIRRDQALSASGGAHEDGDALRNLRQLVEALTDRGSLTEPDLRGLLAHGEVSLRFQRWVLDLIRRVEAQGQYDTDR